MNKKIIAVFCVVILMASVFSACGNKGYLLMKDQNGIEHAYVTDENGSTVLNEQGDIRVYETDANGKIAKDENGKPKENVIKAPEKLISDSEYKTKEFKFTAPDGWKIDGNSYIAVSKDGQSQIQLNVLKESALNYNAAVSEENDMAKKIVEEVKNNNGTAELREGKTKIASNQIDAYYMLFDAQMESEGKKQELHTCAIYFIFNDKIYKAFYQTKKEENIEIEAVVEIFNNLTMIASETNQTNNAN